MVDALYAGANDAGLYTSAQLQALQVAAPVLARNPITGEFILTLGFEKSTDLQSFVPLPLTVPQVTINGQGKLEFRFTAPEPAAFLRVQTN
jgi:hypothetical protein